MPEPRNPDATEMIFWIVIIALALATAVAQLAN